MSHKPFFSVVIPLYNKAPHVARSVGSVLNQTFLDFELIIVNDASTDGSVEEVKKFNDPRIRLLHRDEPGPGGYAARNLGIKEAKAEWVAFLDADDEWYKDYLDQMYKLSLEYPQANFMSCGWHVQNENVRKENSYYKANTQNHIIDLISYLKIHTNGIDFCHTNVVVIQKYLLLNIKGFPVPSNNCKRAGDGQTWLKAMLNGGTAAWTPYIGAIYNQDSVNMVTRLKDYDISENCLITYIEKYLSETHNIMSMNLLEKYKRSRILSNLLRKSFLRKLSLHEWKLLRKSFILDKRFFAIIAVSIIPHFLKKCLLKYRQYKLPEV